MILSHNTTLGGILTISDNYQPSPRPIKDDSIYKIILVKSGNITISIDYVDTKLEGGSLIAISPFHKIDFKEVNGEYQILCFNSNFYCIYGHDDEVSCGGLLFNGISHIPILKLSDEELNKLCIILQGIIYEFRNYDSLFEEMTRTLLKRFIIICTRIARTQLNISDDNIKSFDIIRQFYMLVDNNFKEKKKVQEYASILNRSPKTIARLFLAYSLPTPLQVIHDRILTEAKRLFLGTKLSAKEIAFILGFEDLAIFSRFFKMQCGENISSYRNREKEKN